MALVTCCPKCASEYEVTTDQLKLHDGLVRCGQCSHVFDGFACLKNALPTLTRKVPADTAPLGLPESTPVLKVLAESGEIAQPQADKPESSLASWATPPTPPIPEIPLTPPTATPTPAAPAAPTSSLASDVAPKPSLPSQDGPFVPSVDRQQAATYPALGRQEPRLRNLETKTAGVSQEPVEPSLGQLDETTWQPDPREPSLGGIMSRSESPSAVKADANVQPKVQLFGEARVKGDDPSAFGRTVPEFLEDDDEVSAGASVMWLVGAFVLVIALIVQTLVVFRNDIVAAAPSLRPLLVQLCQTLSCDVSYVRQIDRIFIVGSSLQQAPDTQVGANQRAYVLRLTLQNRSAYPQPWPALMLTLTDASGTAVIKKALLPSVFLPPELLEGPMASRQEVGLDVPLTVDGLNISGYELERFFP